MIAKKTFQNLICFLIDAPGIIDSLFVRSENNFYYSFIKERSDKNKSYNFKEEDKYIVTLDSFFNQINQYNIIVTSFEAIVFVVVVLVGKGVVKRVPLR